MTMAEETQPRRGIRSAIIKIGVAVLVAVGGIGIYVASRVDYPDVVRIGDGAAGGRYASLNEKLEAHLKPILEDKFGSRVERVHTQGSLENVRMLEAGQLHLAFCQEGVASSEQVRSVSNLEYEYLYVVVKEGSDVQSVADLQGRRINPGTQGSGTSILSHQIFEYYPLTRFQESTLGFDDVIKAFERNELDAAFFVSGFQAPALLQMLRTGDYRVLPVPFVPAMRLTHPWISEQVIPAMAFKRLPNPMPAQDIPTLAVKSSIVAGRDVPAPVVEAVVQAILETSFVQDGELVLLRNNQTTGFAYTDTQFPIHEGAQAYYFPWQPTIPSDFVESWNGIIGLLVLAGSGLYTVVSYFRQQKEAQAAQAEAGKKHTLDEYLHRLEEMNQRVLTAGSAAELNALRAEAMAVNAAAAADFRGERFRSAEDFAVFTGQLALAVEQIKTRAEELRG